MFLRTFLYWLFLTISGTSVESKARHPRQTWPAGSYALPRVEVHGCPADVFESGTIWDTGIVIFTIKTSYVSLSHHCYLDLQKFRAKKCVKIRFCVTVNKDTYEMDHVEAIVPHERSGQGVHVNREMPEGGGWPAVETEIPEGGGWPAVKTEIPAGGGRPAGYTEIPVGGGWSAGDTGVPAGGGWPAGKYCVLKTGTSDCPGGLKQGYLTFNLDTLDPEKQHQENIIHGNGSSLVFCCSVTKYENKPIQLPNEKPFFLYPLMNSKCQEVEGMSVTREHVTFQAERREPLITEARVPHAKVVITKKGDLKMYYCFYAPKKVKSPEFTLPVIATLSACLLAGAVIMLVICISRRCTHRKNSLQRVLSRSAKNCYIKDSKVVCNTDVQTELDGSEKLGCLLNTILDDDTKYNIERLLVPQNRLVIQEKIGEGAFGVVYKAQYRSSQTPCHTVAVKCLKETCRNEDIVHILREGVVMSEFSHPNVLCLLGVGVDEDLGLPMLITPFMLNGDLNTYLRKFRYDEHLKEKSPPSAADLVCLSHQIAKGMAYLSSQMIVHRDLATRNCMVSEKMCVKIADFGLTRDVYMGSYYRQGTDGRLPIKWMALESLQDRLFTPASDVWSYGVTLWEIFTLAKTPYPSMENCEVLSYLESGKRLPQPATCPDFIYDTMSECWSAEACRRPSFCDIADKLETYLMKEKGYTVLGGSDKTESDTGEALISSGPDNSLCLADSHDICHPFLESTSDSCIDQAFINSHPEISQTQI